jgi:hypothetical protein
MMKKVVRSRGIALNSVPGMCILPKTDGLNQRNHESRNEEGQSEFTRNVLHDLPSPNSNLASLKPSGKGTNFQGFAGVV